MSKAKISVILFGVLIFVYGLGIYMGWWENPADYIPWFADKGDLKVICYDAMGTVNTSDDKPLANVTVSILSTEYVMQTDANGTALFTDIEVGEYEVQAEWNSVTLTQNATINKDAVTTVTFLFNESAS